MKGPVGWWRTRMRWWCLAIVGVVMAWEPWRVSDGFWERVAPLLPVGERRFRYPGRKRLDDRVCLEGILFVLCSGLPWDAVPRELGVSGVTCWRRFVSRTGFRGDLGSRMLSWGEEILRCHVETEE